MFLFRSITNYFCSNTRILSRVSVPLKVHKIEIFFGFDFEIKILQKKIFDWASIGGGMIYPRSLKTMRNEKNFWAWSTKIFFVFFIYESFLWANTSFSKIRSINCVRDGFMCWSWAKLSKFILLSLRLSGIEFSLVSDYGELSLA